MRRDIHIENSGPPLTLEQIAAFEKEIGGRLPEDYRQFLLAHNGGITNPELALPWTGGCTKVGFTSLMPDDLSGIRASLRYLRNVNPSKVEGYLSIAATDSESDICLAYRGPHAGQVFHTAYKYKVVGRGDLVPIDVTMVPIADSFTDLFDYLVEVPDPYCRICDLGKTGTPDDLAKYLDEGNSIDALGMNDHTILCEAIKYDNVAMVQACIARGASLSKSIYLAVQNCRIDLIEALIKAGADINERDEYGSTPFFYVCGTALPGEEGAQNRALRDLLLKLGATGANPAILHDD